LLPERGAALGIASETLSFGDFDFSMSFCPEYRTRDFMNLSFSSEGIKAKGRFPEKE
jgi:hypothetical protein